MKLNKMKFVHPIRIASNNTEFSNVGMSITKVSIEEIDLFSYMQDEPFYENMKEIVRSFKNKPM